MYCIFRAVKQIPRILLTANRQRPTAKKTILNFQLQHTDPKSNARAGLITTDHGQIETPVFMPVGTVGSVKAVQMTEKKKLQMNLDANFIETRIFAVPKNNLLPIPQSSRDKNPNLSQNPDY